MKVDRVNSLVFSFIGFKWSGCKNYIAIKWYKYGEHVCKLVAFKTKKASTNEKHIDTKGKVIDKDWRQTSMGWRLKTTRMQKYANKVKRITDIRLKFSKCVIHEN